MCRNCDAKYLDYVLPNARKKPFSISRLKYLVKFIENQEKAITDGLCRNSAKPAWDKMEEKKRQLIRERLSEILEKEPDLIFNLKCEYDSDD